MIAQFWNPVTAAGRAALDAINRQAQIIACIGDCNLVMLATLAVAVLTVFHKAPHGRGIDPASGVEL
jgi:MFS transporter, DHA2 family, multidrug resistance protein